MIESVSYRSQCAACGSEMECVGVQALVGRRLEWDISYGCSACGEAMCECGPGGGWIPDDLRRRLLTEHGEARLVLSDPLATPVVVMKVLRAELGGDLAQAKEALQQIRAGAFAGTMPEMTLLAHRLRAAGVEATAERPQRSDEVSACG
ncbi:hypothetical protein [Streptomyces sp. CBMA156]|uniref:hypothetical protein n=1 Tax=Streptomyces sp. CBMA156 TaxID=1930280 RepID=UPI00294FF1BB|nr:hypothetical protein [Streptomyces sp. CBMA156]